MRQFLPLRTRRSTALPTRCRTRRPLLEQLEARQLLAADLADLEQRSGERVSIEHVGMDIDPAELGFDPEMMGPYAPATELPPEVERAFRRVQGVDQYSAEQLALTDRWAIHTSVQIGSDSLGSLVGADQFEVFSGITNTFIYQAEAGEDPHSIAAAFDSVEYIDYYYPLVPLNFELRFVPNDPLFAEQWYLSNTGQSVGNPDDLPIFATPGEDIGVVEAWEQFTGEGVVIAIVDDGIQGAHPDLAPNYDPALSIDIEGVDSNPSPDPTLQEFHGTAVAGIAVGAGANGQGITGVAFDATLAGIRLLSNKFSDEQAFDALTHMQDEIDIYNNSFGPPDDTRLADAFGPMGTQALRDAAFLGRDGLGNINIVAGGNGAASPTFDHSNFDGFANSRFSIAVGAVGHDGVATEYSEGGANILVVAPSGTQQVEEPTTGFSIGSGIVTTDLVGEEGYNLTGINDDNIGRDFLEDIDYTSRFNGTSASAPVVAGVVGLILDANPTLSYRDVQHILARSARQNSKSDLAWQANFLTPYVDPAISPDTGFPIDVELMPPERISEIDLFNAPSALPPVIPGLTTSFGFIPRPTNAAGFTVHDAQDYAYGHGVVDARLAVELAQNWTKTPIERTYGTNEIRFSEDAGEIIAWEEIPDTNGIMVPGGLAVLGDTDTSEFFDLWWNLLEEDEEPPEEVPVLGRYTNIPIFAPDNMSVEWVEVTLKFRDLPEDMSDNLRLALVSPEGTVSDFVNYVPEPVSRPGYSSENTPDDDEVQFEWTYTTQRHWGERLGTDLVDPETGAPIPWQLVIENWSDESGNLFSYEVDFFGTNVPQGRIQGTTGMDANGDEDFNFTGLLNGDTFEPVRDIFTEDVPMFIDSAREPFASEALVYLDLDLDGARSQHEPFFMTGADGNFYFDVPPGNYRVAVEAPEGMTVIGDRSMDVSLGFDMETGVNITRARNVNFLFAPEAITLEGTFSADLNGNGVLDDSEPGARGFTLWVDANDNGVFDFVDNNFNLEFEPGFDEPIDPIGITDGAGNYSIVVDTSVPLYRGSGYYQVNVLEREGWTLTAPEVGNHRLYVTTGETIEGLDFLAEPEVGLLVGVVFNDVNMDGLRAPDEVGLEGFHVYLDLDQDGIQGFGEPEAVTSETGAYGFFELVPGNYVVRAVIPSGWEQTAPMGNRPQLVELGAGEAAIGRDFGLHNVAVTDFGNAPGPYPTSLADDGARHKILGGYQLGSIVHGTPDGVPDDMPSDNDGVVFDSTTLTRGQLHTVEVTASRPGAYLQTWIDYNRDGDWDDEGERIFKDRLLASGVNVLSFTVPLDAVGGTTYARFRYGEFGIDDVRGEANLGEVEDYRLEVFAMPAGPTDVNQDGIVSQADVEIVSDNYGVAMDATNAQGDVDSDGDVDGFDLLETILSLGTTVTDSASEAPAAAAALNEAGAGFLAPEFNSVGNDIGDALFGMSIRPSASLTTQLLTANSPQRLDSQREDAANAFVSDVDDFQIVWSDASTERLQEGGNLHNVGSQDFELARIAVLEDELNWI